MPVRVRVRIRRLGSSLETVRPALLNTGFTSDELDIHLPRDVSKELGLWPPPREASLETIDTAGGEILTYYVRDAVEVTVLAGDRESKSIVCNVLTSLHERDVLLSDAVIEELEIEILSPRSGYWRFRGESVRRESI